MISSAFNLRKKILACWLGKAVGGTLGGPYEGVRHTLDLSYYDPVPTKMLPNDDLDAQVVYAFLLDKMDQPRVDRQVLSVSWQHVGMSPDEYGICKRNLAQGLLPPLTGSYDNPFAQGMGAAIRTEIWACLAPGNPELAAQYAYEDACMDHAGEGIYAAQFLAALESLAFVESDREVLLNIALSYLPKDSLVSQAISDTRYWWAESRDWRKVQKQLADRYLVDNFTDVVINLAYIVLGWLAGEDDFGKAICIAVNCGQDTDCTGATLGSLLGILDPDCIDEKWLRPIGRDLVLSPSVTGVNTVKSLDEFTDLVIDLRERVGGRPPEVTDAPQSAAHLQVRAEVGFGDDLRVLSDPALPLLPLTMSVVQFPGLMAEMDADQIKGEILYLRYTVQFKQARQIKLLFNTPEICRVWFDEKLALSREGGDFVPAMHRAPKDQLTKLEVTGGSHEITVAIRKPREPRRVRWCIGLGEVSGRNVCDNWLVGVFDHVGQAADVKPSTTGSCVTGSSAQGGLQPVR